MEEIKLELMDWKTVEAASERELRRAMVEVILHGRTLDLAKKQIKKLGGKTSEEEAAEAKEKAEEEAENTSVG